MMQNPAADFVVIEPPDGHRLSTERLARAERALRILELAYQRRDGVDDSQPEDSR